MVDSILSRAADGERITADMDAVFDHLANQNRRPRLQRLLMAPFDLQRSLIEKIDAVGLAAERGEGGRIVAKMNALTDEDLIDALVRAGSRLSPCTRGRKESVSSTGRLKEMVVPWPNRLCTCISPPCRATKLREMCSPSPVPP